MSPYHITFASRRRQGTVLCLLLLSSTYSLAVKIPVASLITPRGQFTAHMPQAMHKSCLITACPFSTRMAPAGQTRAQILQPMQPASQAAFVSFAFAALLQSGWIVFSAGTSSIICCGQTFTHSPQPMQSARSTPAGAPSGSVIARLGQAATHVPQPRQPRAQSPAPPSGRESAADPVQMSSASRAASWTPTSISAAIPTPPKRKCVSCDKKYHKHTHYPLRKQRITAIIKCQVIKKDLLCDFGGI